MKPGRIDHTGYLVPELAHTGAAYLDLGYTALGEPTVDPVQKARIQLLEGPCGDRIELVEPLAENRSLRQMLEKRGPGIYHICYETENINALRESMIEAGWTALSMPVPARALGGRKICYCWKEEVGFIELVNKD